MKKHYRAEDNCLNCGTKVTGNFCIECGQENLELKEPFWHFIGHSIAHYFHFDSKFFNTLTPLLTKPGQLTLEYIAGRRTRFLHPVSMYIFVSIVYFLLVSLTKSTESDNVETESVTIQKKPDQTDSLSSEEKQALKYIPKNFRNTVKGSFARANEYNYFRSLNFIEQQTYLDSLKKIKPDQKSSDRIAELTKVHISKEDSTNNSYLNRQSRLPSIDRDNFFERFIKKRSIKLKQITGKELNISELGEKYASKLYFLLMPVFAYFVMLNFRRNKRYYIEHLIFTIHFFTAFFIIQIITQPVLYFLPSDLSNVLNFVILIMVLWYSYKALRLFYDRSVWVTIRKMVSLSILYGIAFVICALIIGSFAFIVL